MVTKYEQKNNKILVGLFHIPFAILALINVVVLIPVLAILKIMHYTLKVINFAMGKIHQGVVKLTELVFGNKVGLKPNYYCERLDQKQEEIEKSCSFKDYKNDFQLTVKGIEKEEKNGKRYLNTQKVSSPLFTLSCILFYSLIVFVILLPVTQFNSVKSTCKNIWHNPLQIPDLLIGLFREAILNFHEAFKELFDLITNVCVLNLAIVKTTFTLSKEPEEKNTNENIAATSPA